MYLKGRSLFIARSKPNLIEAARVLRAAVAKDLKLARAWEMLGAVLVTGKYWDAGDESEYKAGSDVILRVGSLDDDPGVTPQFQIWASHEVPWLSYGKHIVAYAEWELTPLIRP